MNAGLQAIPTDPGTDPGLVVQAARLAPGQRVLAGARGAALHEEVRRDLGDDVDLVVVTLDDLAGLLPGHVRPFDRAVLLVVHDRDLPRVVQAYDLLQPGGRLVALLLDASPVFESWLAAHDGDALRVPDAGGVLVTVDRPADAPVFRKAADVMALRAHLAAMATDRAALETDLVHLDEDDLPMAKAAGAVTRAATLVHARAAMLGELAALEEGVEALARELRGVATVPAPPSFVKARSGGPGSRGGRVIGYTKSGQPIYDRFHHAAHEPFARGDHLEAAEAHRRAIAMLEAGGAARGDLVQVSRVHEIERGLHVRAAARSSVLPTGPVEGAHERAVGAAARQARVPEAWRTLSDDRLLAAARAELRRLVDAKATASHPELEAIRFTKETFGESLHRERKSREELLLVADLPKLLPHAQRVATEKPWDPSEARTGIRAYHKLELMVRVGAAKPFLMRFTVRENRDGQCFYVFRRARNTRPVTKSAGSVANSPGQASLGMRVAPRVAEQTESRFTEPALDESLLDGLLLLKSRRLHGRRWLDGLHVSIENRRGSVRRWYDRAADTQGATTMRHPYGTSAARWASTAIRSTSSWARWRAAT